MTIIRAATSVTSMALVGLMLLLAPARADDHVFDATWLAARDRGWVEALISVSDAAPLRRFAREVAGWRELAAFPIDPPQLDFYTAKPIVGHQPRQWLLGDAARTPGLVRILQFNDSASVAIRAGANPWDTGGILSLMTRSNRTLDVYHAAQRQGWNAINDPVELVLPDTGVRLTNVIVRGPDAVSISIYERLSPRLPDEPDLLRLRRPFNAMQSVRDISLARRFYTEVLGFEIVSQGEFPNQVRAPNNFGTPANLVVLQPILFTIVGPRKDGPTQVELVQMPGVEGRDLAQRARPPNLGILGLRFPVTDLSVIRERLAAYQWPVARSASRLHIAPWGLVNVLAVQAPDGAWLEFLQKATP